MKTQKTESELQKEFNAIQEQKADAAANIDAHKIELFILRAQIAVLSKLKNQLDNDLSDLRTRESEELDDIKTMQNYINSFNI